MPVDAVLSRELRSLQEELARSQQERSAAASRRTGVAHEATTNEPAAPPISPDDAREEQILQQQIRELSDEVTKFFEQAEKSVSEHPARSVLAALLLGMVIGCLSGRR